MVETDFRILRDIPDPDPDIILVHSRNFYAHRAGFPSLFLVEIAPVAQRLAVVPEYPFKIVLKPVLVIIVGVSGCLGRTTAPDTDRVPPHERLASSDIFRSSPPPPHLDVVVLD